jgi:hypothetical protein
VEEVLGGVYLRLPERCENYHPGKADRLKASGSEVGLKKDEIFCKKVPFWAKNTYLCVLQRGRAMRIFVNDEMGKKIPSPGQQTG